MIDAVFISDLHLHPDEVAIMDRFHGFLEWAIKNVRTIYILGDFFHVWAGDDALDDWSRSIAKALARLASKGKATYFMPGNRDFLLGHRFLELARMNMLKDPSIITLGGEPILLTHGDRYCTKDRGHQWLRRLTRNRVFPKLFLSCPYKIRATLVNKVRQRSQDNCSKSPDDLAVVPASMLHHMQQLDVNILIHGHIHQSALHHHEYQGVSYRQYVLSDWDDNPTLLCYNKANGFYFDRILGG